MPYALMPIQNLAGIMTETIKKLWNVFFCVPVVMLSDGIDNIVRFMGQLLPSFYR